MKINRDNYIIWITDFYDDRLSVEEKEVLLSFLDLNPDLKEEFEIFKEIKVHPDISSRIDKASLHKSVFDIDPELTVEEFDLLTSAYGTKKDFISSASLKLLAQDIEYPYKNGLKRIPIRRKTIFILTRGLAAAASIALIFSLFTLLPGNRNTSETYFTARVVPFNQTPVDNHKTLIPILSNKRVSPKQINIRDSFRESVSTENIIADQIIEREVIQVSPVSYIGEAIVSGTEKEYPQHLIPVNEIDVPIDYPDLSPRQFLAMNFRKIVLKDDEENAEKIKLHEYAGAGVDGLNKLLGWDMKFEKEIDEEGRLKAYKLSSQLINLDRTTKIADY